MERREDLKPGTQDYSGTVAVSVSVSGAALSDAPAPSSALASVAASGLDSGAAAPTSLCGRAVHASDCIAWRNTMTMLMLSVPRGREQVEMLA